MKPGTQGYLSSTLAAAGGTLIRFCSEASGAVTVPAGENNVRLSVLGAGSVVANQAASVIVEEGYTRFNARCIQAGSAARLAFPASLRSAESPLHISGQLFPLIELKRSLTDAVRRELAARSVPVGGGRRMLDPEMFYLPELAPLPALIANVQGLPLQPESAEARFLFFRTPQENKTIFDKRDCLDFRGGSSGTEEYAAVMRMIREGNTGLRDAAAELQNDRLIHGQEKDPWLQQYRNQRICVLFTDPSELRITGVHMFAPALYPIRYGGREWFLYSRLHLTADPDLAYLREDVCVFTREGLVTDGSLSDAVYLKARMMMSL